LLVECESEVELDRPFAALAAGGKVMMSRSMPIPSASGSAGLPISDYQCT
jgi:hypothetical protein